MSNLPQFGSHRRCAGLFGKLLVAVVTCASSAAAQPALNQAIAGSAAIGYTVPPGWSVQFGSTSTGAMGECDHNSQTITIDPAAIDATTPGLSGDASGLPGVISYVLIHEILHIPDGGTPGGNNACIEAAHQAEVAAVNCADATELVASGIGGTPLQNVCAFYNNVQDHYSGQVDPPGAAEAWAAAGCSGSLPAMPECPACQ